MPFSKLHFYSIVAFNPPVRFEDSNTNIGIPVFHTSIIFLVKYVIHWTCSTNYIFVRNAYRHIVYYLANHLAIDQTYTFTIVKAISDLTILIFY